uniref:uncharacterized protein LOC123462295 n=1 Tax=Jaculus jaculus TaxID=51337 RepID=UPI001E1B1318|nr:uncharacterized protein LOC123462295 [Jaculus jaculus]
MFPPEDTKGTLNLEFKSPDLKFRSHSHSPRAQLSYEPGNLLQGDDVDTEETPNSSKQTTSACWECNLVDAERSSQGSGNIEEDRKVPPRQDDRCSWNSVRSVVDYLPTALKNGDYYFFSSLVAFPKKFATIWEVLGLIMERYPSFQPDCKKDQKAKKAITILLSMWMEWMPEEFCESPDSLARMNQLKAYVILNMPSSHLVDHVQHLLSALDVDECKTDSTKEEEDCDLASSRTGSSVLQAQDDTWGTLEALQIEPASLAVPTGDLPPKEEPLHPGHTEPHVTAAPEPAPVTMEPSEAAPVFQGSCTSGTAESASLPTAVGREPPPPSVDSAEAPPAVTADSPSGCQEVQFEVTSIGSYPACPLPDVDN